VALAVAPSATLFSPAGFAALAPGIAVEFVDSSAALSQSRSTPAEPILLPSSRGRQTVRRRSSARLASSGHPSRRSVRSAAERRPPGEHCGPTRCDQEHNQPAAKECRTGNCEPLFPKILCSRFLVELLERGGDCRIVWLFLLCGLQGLACSGLRWIFHRAMPIVRKHQGSDDA